MHSLVVIYIWLSTLIAIYYTRDWQDLRSPKEVKYFLESSNKKTRIAVHVIVLLVSLVFAPLTLYTLIKEEKQNKKGVKK